MSALSTRCGKINSAKCWWDCTTRMYPWQTHLTSNDSKSWMHARPLGRIYWQRTKGIHGNQNPRHAGVDLLSGKAKLSKLCSMPCKILAGFWFHHGQSKCWPSPVPDPQPAWSISRGRRATRRLRSQWIKSRCPPHLPAGRPGDWPSLCKLLRKMVHNDGKWWNSAE